ncbi:MAG: hypothetical protein EHM63_00185 [Actinobacteria bacterium]|nr:MAG: hypothetical protein EHM63_00185 [Actinomycetota bacterium]
MLRKPLALLFAAALVVTLAACGGDDSDSSAPDEGSDSTEAPAASSEAPDSSAGGDESAASTGAPDFSGEGGGEFCSQAQGFDEVFGEEAFQSNDPADLEDQFNASQQALADLENSAPDEIKEDVGIIADALAGLIEVFESANYDFTQLAQDPDAVAQLEAFNSAEITDASTRVEAYLTEVCGIDADG